MKYTINRSVGRSGANIDKDVRLIQSLLCVYLRNNSQTTIAINGNCDNKTIETITSFQKNFVKLTKPDGLVAPNGKTFTALVSCLKSVLGAPQSLFYPKEGKFTFTVEGHEGGIFHSRILHVPNEKSGLTLGRGFDMKKRETTEIFSYLIKSGISVTHAKMISKASKLKGESARMFVINNDLLDFQITPRQQKNLFIVTYEYIESEVLRLCSKKDVVNTYGETDWDALDSKIKTILIDLRFRGDYHPESRKFIQKSIIDNDVDAFKQIINDRSKWAKVPQNRFDKRANYLK